jgi:hypothetical protein
MLDCAETASAAMRSEGDPQRLRHNDTHNDSAARFVNRSDWILFQNRVIAGCILLPRPDTAH